ncbi:PadR family transcriptional regulator [Nocardia sp. CA-128927]|uniref:PadR family transcriptional regulator n=1 Tax=Nocardia sp. CA-128927 TaxID=3239975 RepID=UPI003D9927F2
MALRHAVLTALLDNELSGYDLAKAFGEKVGLFWHASPQQLYAELARLEDAGLITGREVLQRRRPPKRLLTLTDAGLAELTHFAAESAKPSFLRDELLVKVHAERVADTDALIEQLEDHAARAAAKAQVLGDMLTGLRGPKHEAAYLATTNTPGPYLVCVRGRLFEQEKQTWCTWAADVLRARTAGRPIPPLPPR